jgi:hypothetical protein
MKLVKIKKTYLHVFSILINFNLKSVTQNKFILYIYFYISNQMCVYLFLISNIKVNLINEPQIILKQVIYLILWCKMFLKNIF